MSILVGKWYDQVSGSYSIGQTFKILEIGPGHVVIRLAVSQTGYKPPMHVLPLADFAKAWIVETSRPAYDVWEDKNLQTGLNPVLDT